MSRSPPHPALALFNPAVQGWFESVFPAPTLAQARAWPVIANRDSTLLLAPTGSGKTLAAFLHCLDRLMFQEPPPVAERCRLLYLSPLKALAVDVERNLRAPLEGIAQVATARGDRFHRPEVWVRTGDTPAAERVRFARTPADLLITTPESLYLLLTSDARAALRFVDTVIVDEIHALVPTKRGTHLAVSLERLEALVQRPLQRIGLSATQRPLEEVARFLGGVERRSAAPESAVGVGSGVEAQLGTGEQLHYRPVTVVDASEPKPLSLRIEVPVEQMTPPQALPGRSLWNAIHPRLVELVRRHTSTLIFVNSRRSAERLAGALNELAQETLVHAHHGSIARAQRQEIEESLKAGRLKGLVATSSLELGIDMGAIDLVLQIETPPSVASALQRIGRAGHQVAGESRGVLFPKHRADLVASAAITRAMRDGRVERSRYPRNALDIVAQQVVAMVAMEPWSVEALFAVLRAAAPFADLRRSSFESVLDLLSGRYPSEAFAELRPRIVWDRVSSTLTTREGARRVAVVNGGTIPDRGLYGVFLAGAERPGARVGELDEEMVFESRVGDTFILGASTWRIEEITHDRVLVSPAPGQPGRMPFWRGEGAGRPLELGREIGKLVRELRALPPEAAVGQLVRAHDLDPQAAENLLAYLREQATATGEVPDDRTLVVERVRDELGDWRVCLLSPLGGQVHAPWSMAAVAKIRAELGLQVESVWSNDGFVLRFPDLDRPPDPQLLIPTPEEVEARVMEGLGGSALFAARFRENAARALLLPRRRPGARTPLWKQRRRAADLLAVAAQHPTFPMLLETYRECLRDLFDLPALRGVLEEVQAQKLKVVTMDSRTPSPFAANLLFGFVANYLYEGDAPLAERRAQALAVDPGQLRELLGEPELRELLDPDALAEVERELQQLAPGFRARSRDGIHDLLRRLGDLSLEEIVARSELPGTAPELEELVRTGRIVTLGRSDPVRYLAIEDVARYRDGLQIPPPLGVPAPLLEAVADPEGDLLLRYARTHGPFTLPEVARWYAGPLPGLAALARRWVLEGRLLEGAFRPHGTSLELCDPDVLRSIRRRSLAKLRREVEPVEPSVLGRLAVRWSGVGQRRRGLDALLDTVEKLQACALPASILETEILPARLEGYTPSDLDALAAAGELVWVGVEPLGERDGRLALFLTDSLPKLWSGPAPADPADDGRTPAMRQLLLSSGGAFFPALHQAAGGGSLQTTLDALWSMVWRGEVTNDSLRPLRAFLSSRAPRERRPASGHFRSRRATPPMAEGRWSLVEQRARPRSTPTEHAAAVALQLLARYGVLTREGALAEDVGGGFSGVYTLLKGLEETGRIRRGYFVSGVSAAQFALPPALELLRTLRRPAETPEAVALAATDPANPYGALLPWPEIPGVARGPSRTVGASVVLVDGALAAYLSRGGRQLWVDLPPDERARTAMGRAMAAKVAELARRPELRNGGGLIAEVNGVPAREHSVAGLLVEAGFAASAQGLYLPFGPREVTSPAESLLLEGTGREGG